MLKNLLQIVLLLVGLSLIINYTDSIVWGFVGGLLIIISLDWRYKKYEL